MLHINLIQNVDLVTLEERTGKYYEFGTNQILIMSLNASLVRIEAKDKGCCRGVMQAKILRGAQLERGHGVPSPERKKE